MQPTSEIKWRVRTYTIDNNTSGLALIFVTVRYVLLTGIENNSTPGTLEIGTRWRARVLKKKKTEWLWGNKKRHNETHGRGGRKYQRQTDTRPTRILTMENYGTSRVLSQYSQPMNRVRGTTRGVRAHFEREFV